VVILLSLIGGCSITRLAPTLTSDVASAAVDRIVLDVHANRGDLLVWPYGNFPSSERKTYRMTFRIDRPADIATLIEIRDITDRENSFPSDKDLYDGLAQKRRVDQALATWQLRAQPPPGAMQRDARRSDDQWLILLENYPETFDWTLQSAQGVAAHIRIDSGRTIYWGWDAQQSTIIFAGMFSNEPFYFWSYRNPGSDLETISLNLPLYFDDSDHHDGRIALKKQFYSLLIK